MKNKLVVCNRADKRCGFCDHIVQHKPMDGSFIDGSFLYIEKKFCTTWAECVLYDPNETRKVRCIKVKG